MAIFSSSPSSWLALPATWYDSEIGHVAQGGSADAEAVAEQNRGLLLLPCHASASVYSYGVTRRCQERRYLLRFKKDRRQYLQRLREAIARYPISVLNYMPTSNHVHLVVWCDHAEDLSAAMQYVSGSGSLGTSVLIFLRPRLLASLSGIYNRLRINWLVLVSCL